ncbi:MAG: PP2C family protein-serine/threonine phosphatase [Candidatus Gracilibacteria bacterium]|nr:PP2C family protein-serine/threonine phosphatase [Candidatus Gracilibacteria bacterium]
MSNKRNYFDFGVALIIIIIMLSNVILLKYLEKIIIENGGGINGDVIIGFVLFIEAIIIIFMINKSYQNPIKELNEHINDFISGKSRGENVNIKTNYSNPNIRYVLKFFDVILNSLKNIKNEFISGKAIKGEVQLAKELQEKLLNKKLEKIPSIDIIAKSKPAGEVGGDSYDVIKEGENYYIYVGDATGHGVGAGFVMVMVNALVSGFAKIFKSSAQILANTNEILKPRIKSNILMTLLMVRWNEEEKRFFMAGAGHEYLIIYKQALKKCFLIKSGGLALGMTKNIHKILKEQEIKFEKDDIAVLYSDGITESINQNKKDGLEQMFGENRLKEAIENAPDLPGINIKSARSVFNNITIMLSKFMGYKHKQFDDITLVVLHYKGDRIIEKDVSEVILEDFITEWNWNT